jgi:ribosomal protein S12 methylthiotransferase
VTGTPIKGGVRPPGNLQSCEYRVLNTQNGKRKTKNRLYAVSLGCAKNLVDTEIMLGRLTQGGWEVTDSPEAAQLLVVNTCAFIAAAAQEAVDTILELSRYKQEDPGKRLAVTGCLVQRHGEKLPELLPEVDFFIGVNDFPRIEQIISEAQESGGSRLFTQAPLYDFRGPEARFPATPRHTAYLKIAEGCSHRCTFCTIPRIRGPYRSRPLKTLLIEAQRLAARGVKELNLVAQDTTAYGREGGGAPGLPELLRELHAIPDLRWIRLLYGHPARITRELLMTMADLPRVAPYLDLPIQHGHDDMLKRMGRGYGRRDILGTIGRIRNLLPGAALRTTVMAGFPGETEEHFQALLDLVDQARFDHLGVFTFSPEEDTPAARLTAPVPRRVANHRGRRLKQLQARLVKERLKALVGSCQEVLVEGVSPESEYLLTGRLITQAPEVDGQVYITAGTGHIGAIQTVRLTRALKYDLVGEIVE